MLNTANLHAPNLLPRNRSRPQISSSYGNSITPPKSNSGPLLSGGVGVMSHNAEPTHTPYVYLLVLLAVIGGYLVFRWMLMESNQGLTGFNPQFCYYIHGYTTDNSQYQRLKCWAKEIFLQEPGSKEYVKFVFSGPVTRKEFVLGLSKVKERLGEAAKLHATSPIVWEGCDESNPHYIGDGDSLIRLLKERHRISKGSCLA